jgi:tellurite resistance protein TehA-like permease
MELPPYLYTMHSLVVACFSHHTSSILPSSPLLPDIHTNSLCVFFFFFFHVFIFHLLIYDLKSKRCPDHAVAKVLLQYKENRMGSQLTEKHVALYILCPKSALTRWYLVQCWLHWRKDALSSFFFIIKV